MTIQFTDMSEEIVGFIPHFLDRDNPKGAVEQINDNYAHGGGWNDFEGFKMRLTEDGFALEYEGDPPLPARSVARLRNELIAVFDYGWVAVIQLDATFRVARID